MDLHVRTPLRLVDRHAHSGFSSVSMGLLPFSFSNQPLDRITYSRTSSYLDSPGWTPTEFSGHLVYLPAPNATRAELGLPLGSQGTLHFALYGNGQGQAAFRIERPTTGETLFTETVQVAGECGSLTRCRWRESAKHSFP